MAASYPSSVKVFQTHVNITEVIDAGHPNTIQDEVVAIESTLGVTPNLSTTPNPSNTFNSTSTSFADVTTRLANIETGIVSDAHTQYIRKTADASNTITAGSASTKPIVLKGASSQTANLQEWQNNSGTALAKVDASGNVTAASFVKTGGTSSQFLKADGSVDTATYITGAVTSLAGTTNQVAVSAATGAVTVSLPTNVTISGASTAGSFVKSGGTSSQFLKADGSVDSSTYLTTSAAASAYQAKFTLNATPKTALYTLAASDYETMIQMNGAYAFSLTTALSAAPAGTQIHLLALTTGVSVSATGVTLNGTPGLKLRAAYSSATLICLSSNNWVLIGDLSA